MTLLLSCWKMQPLTKTIPAPEHIEQVRFINWFKDNFKEPDYIIFSVPNGGKRGKFEAKRLKDEGLMSGVSDLIILHHSKILFLEMKRTNTKLSPSQKKFFEKLKKQNIDFIVGYGATDASQKILDYFIKNP